MAISLGPKLGLLYNALINEEYFDALRLLLQSIDQLIMGNVINATTVVPPTTPSPGDAYLLTGGTPSGAWTGQAGNIAVWDAQLTNTGTNTVVPGWIFLVPKAGWLVFNVALSSLVLYNGSTWGAVGGGANFPTNTNITSMTGIPNTAISTTGYAYNDGINPPTAIGEVATAGANANGYQYGTGTFAAPTTAGTAIIGKGPWTGLAAGGVGVGVSTSGTGGTVMTAAGIETSGQVEGNNGNFLTLLRSGTLLKIAGQGIVADAADTTMVVAGLAMATVGKPAIQFNAATASPTSRVGLIGFASNYFTQTTVGAAGSASALPANPKGYLQFVAPDGSVCVFPYYAYV